MNETLKSENEKIIAPNYRNFHIKKKEDINGS